METLLARPTEYVARDARTEEAIRWWEDFILLAHGYAANACGNDTTIRMIDAITSHEKLIAAVSNAIGDATPSSFPEAAERVQALIRFSTNDRFESLIGKFGDIDWLLVVVAFLQAWEAASHWRDARTEADAENAAAAA
jgi:hypothetical protein